VVGAMAVLSASAAFGQQAELHPAEGLKFSEAGPVLRQAVQTGEPFTVAGQRGLIVGQQQGVMEAWVLPVKLLSHMTIEANVENYPVPLDLNSMAREIEVRPDRTTITYAHIAMTLTQTMFAPDHAPAGTGAVVVFQIQSVRPVNLVFRFISELRKMWPALSSDSPSAEWVARGASGFYVLHSDFPDFAAAAALPGATSGVMAPYQERPQVNPLEFRLHFDPKTDARKQYPLLMAVGETADTASTASLEARLNELNSDLASLYAQHAAHYREQEKLLTEIVTPDAGLNRDFEWAETSIGQLQARTDGGEIGLVAGYYASGDSARPGFGWFFGRDALFALYAIDSYGDFPLARKELEFLLRRQREDGKIIHEYSQTADQVDWKSLPYEYAAADSTPLFLTAMLDYVRASGDIPFLREHAEQVRKAWRFETAHDANGDGVYDNAQGTGWVESWPTGMPKQEIYLASLDEQASRAMAELGKLLRDAALAEAAKQRADAIHKAIEREYFNSNSGLYAFSFNNGRPDEIATIFPAIAWWNADSGLDHPQAMLRRWASHDFDTDWGLRDVAASEPIYDPISYHQGSVWPLYTGWAAMAQYRAGNALAGYQAAMQNADLTTAQDIGAVTELLSGGYYEPFGRSTSHQLWSSAMVVTPILRGLFGVEVNTLKHEIAVTPHLPAAWDQAEVKRLHVGSATVDIAFKRQGMHLLVTLQQVSGEKILLAGAGGNGTELSLPLPAVEIGLGHGLPLRGAATAQMKVLSETTEAHSVKLEVEGMAGTEALLTVRRNDSGVKVTATGAELDGDQLRVSFDAGTGYEAQTLTLSW